MGRSIGDIGGQPPGMAMPLAFIMRGKSASFSSGSSAGPLLLAQDSKLLRSGTRRLIGGAILGLCDRLDDCLENVFNCLMLAECYKIAAPMAASKILR